MHKTVFLRLNFLNAFPLKCYQVQRHVLPTEIYPSTQKAASPLFRHWLALLGTEPTEVTITARFCFIVGVLSHSVSRNC